MELNQSSEACSTYIYLDSRAVAATVLMRRLEVERDQQASFLAHCPGRGGDLRGARIASQPIAGSGGEGSHPTDDAHEPSRYGDNRKQCHISLGCLHR